MAEYEQGRECWLNGPKTDLEKIVDNLVTEAEELLGELLIRTQGSDERSKLHGAAPSERHPVQLLLEAAKESRRALPGAIVKPWLLAELRMVLGIIARWRGDSVWKEIEPSLVNAAEFMHTISTLLIAEHLKKEGHKVRLIPTVAAASPDLELQAVGGSQDWIRVECYQPVKLNGGQATISNADAMKIVNRAMKKARRQLGDETPGIAAICVAYQAETNMETLRKAVEGRLQQTYRLNLCGIMTLNRGMRVSSMASQHSVEPTVSFEFFHTPSYFGRVEVVDSSGIEASSESSGAETLGAPKVVRLEPPKDTEGRVVMLWTGSSSSPFFKGAGDMNCQCGGCEYLLAERIWRLSCTNLVVRCPSCKTHREFVALDDPALQRTQNIAIRPDTYPLSGTLFVRGGVCLFGL